MTLSINPSKHLSRHQCERIFVAGAFAYCSGHPFNQFVSIHLNLAEVEASQVFISRFLKLFGDWLRRNAKHQAYWLWVLENPPYCEESVGGLNVHILIHVPSKLIAAFRHLARKWITLAGGKQKNTF